MKGFWLSISLLALFSLSAMADEDTALAKEFPELQQLLLAHDIVQARVYEEISLTNESDAAAIGQKVLLEMIVAEKSPSASSMSLIGSLLSSADQKRMQAIALAEQGKFDQAVLHQEKAIDDLVRAMRTAGVYF